MRLGGEGVLNPCGFVGCDLPCVQVAEPLLPPPPPKQMPLFSVLHRPPPRHFTPPLDFLLVFSFLAALVGFAEVCRLAHVTFLAASSVLADAD